jgi:hypothetical protein
MSIPRSSPLASAARVAKGHLGASLAQFGVQAFPDLIRPAGCYTSSLSDTCRYQKTPRFRGKAPVHRADVRSAGSGDPSGADWLYEVKFDGYRCLAGRDSTGVTLWSQARKPLHAAVSGDRKAQR